MSSSRNLGMGQRMSDPTLAVEIRDLVFRYPDGAFELRLDRLDIGARERLAVAGPSGCGKSTLLDVIAGVHGAGAGQVIVAGLDLGRASETQRRRHRARSVGFVFQDHPTLQSLDVIENVLLPYRLSPALVLDDAVRERARRLLARLEIAGHEHKRPSVMSRGEVQRLAIARALVTEPRILLADEPTAGLDPAQGQNAVDLLLESAGESGVALLVVSHDPAILERFDRVVELAPRGAPVGTESER